MDRLQQELQRLYAPLPHDTGGAAQSTAAPAVRCMVLELADPADWATLAKVWQEVQLTLDLPPPAIAVSGQGGYQLWFSLASAVPAPLAGAFLQALVQRHLADCKPRRIRMAPDAAGGWPVGPVPALQADGERWSAFVSADLAPMFADTPWLDTAPNPDGQAMLLATLQCTAAADFQQALQLCGVSAAAPAGGAGGAGVAGGAAGAGGAGGADVGAAEPAAGAPPLPAAAAPPPGPRQFLLSVMHDAGAPLALRIEAAKALLPGS